MASYLVTGGCGFIGSHLADALAARGHRVRILDDLSTGRRAYAPAKSELVVADVADPAAVRHAMAGMNGCFHMAAIPSVQRSVEAWLDTHRVNLGGTICVLDAARAAGAVPVVYASSAAVYGDSAALPLAETAPLTPLSPYGADKAASELQAAAAFAIHRVPSTGLRLFNVFGPRQDPASPYSGVISIFAENMIADRPLTIFGDGRQSRDFIYVGDVVGAVLAAMDRQDKSARVFNVGRGERTDLLQLIATMERVTGRKAVVRYAPPRPGDVRHSQADAARLRAGLGFAAKIGLEEGLAALMSWLESEGAVPAPSA
ncbi:MAG TPA: NAD-dependent epimerase/dehydratase family protein [Alphaproteobacteria bacterium]|jgi:UDP-glucose 4-epimerase